MFNPEQNLNKNNEQDLSLKLETSRFQISNESLEFMKKSRIHLQELQKTKPEVLGLGFFGSRVTKNEHDESDLDCMIFYDGSAYDKKEVNKPVYNPNTGEFDYKKVILDEPEMHDKDTIYRQLRSSLYEINYEDSSPIPYEIPNSVDISDTGIKRSIKNFDQLLIIKNTPDNAELALFGKEGKPRGAVWEMISPFLLSIGDGVYNARTKILNELEKMENGEQIWKEIMFCLSYIERDNSTKKRGPLPKYKFYPQTIEEAKKFFKVL
jgi:hypothetical protein